MDSITIAGLPGTIRRVGVPNSNRTVWEVSVPSRGVTVRHRDDQIARSLARTAVDKASKGFNRSKRQRRR